jgi:hypothetical protein
MHAQSWIGVKHRDWLAIRCMCGNTATYGRNMELATILMGQQTSIGEPADSL